MKKGVVLLISILISLALLTSCEAKKNISGDTLKDDMDNLINATNSTNEAYVVENGDEGITININPLYSSKWKGAQEDDTANIGIQDVNTTVINNRVIINMQVPTADGIEIYFLNGSIIKTHDTVKIDKIDTYTNRIIIAGDSYIDGSGNIIEEGTGKFTVINKDSVKTDINGGNQPTYTGDNADSDANVNYIKSGLNGIIDLLPYMSKSAIDEIAKKEYERADSLDKLNEIIISVMSKNLLNELAVKQYEKNGFKSIPDTVICYINQNTLDDFAIKEYEQNGMENISGTLLFYISKDTVDDLAIKEYERNGSENFNKELYWKMSDGLKQELEINESDISNNSSNNHYDYDFGWGTLKGNDNDGITFEFTNGIKITSLNSGTNTSINGKDGEVKFRENCIIKYTNGVIIEAPCYTLAKIMDEVFTITIGDGDATITKLDGISSTIPQGTVLDDEGNIIK